ncbi:hypothetical protein EON65_19360 [archaeon]|nr:MAG: hypothetical protein EON65_19360 [archaeon]
MYGDVPSYYCFLYTLLLQAKLKRIRLEVKAIKEQGKSYRELLAATRHARQQQQSESSKQALQTSE